MPTGAGCCRVLGAVRVVDAASADAKAAWRSTGRLYLRVAEQFFRLNPDLRRSSALRRHCRAAFSRDQIVEFVNSHTDDGDPTMGRPGRSQIEDTLANGTTSPGGGNSGALRLQRGQSYRQS